MVSLRKTLAALLGATVALAPGVMGACYTVFGPILVNPDGTPDNPPMRGAGLFLLASPVLFVILVAFYALTIQLLHRVARLSRASICSVGLAAAAALWVLLVIREGELSSDTAIGITVVSAVIASCLLAGSLASWIVLSERA
jgi:hypothetical protein